MRDEKWGIIVNPCSGRRKIRKDWINIYRKLKIPDENKNNKLKKKNDFNLNSKKY